jgi:hypothetical protein
MVSVLPVILPGPEKTEKVTALPDGPPVADRAMGAIPYVTDEGAVKLIVCALLFTVSVTVAVAVV